MFIQGLCMLAAPRGPGCAHADPLPSAMAQSATITPSKRQEVSLHGKHSNMFGLAHHKVKPHQGLMERCLLNPLLAGVDLVSTFLSMQGRQGSLQQLLLSMLWRP